MYIYILKYFFNISNDICVSVCMYTHARVVSSIGYTDLARSPLLPKVGLSFKNKLKNVLIS